MGISGMMMMLGVYGPGAWHAGPLRESRAVGQREGSSRDR